MAPCVTYKTSIRSVSCVIKFSTPWPDKLILLSEIPDNSDKIQSSGLSLARMSRFWTIEFSVDFRQAGLIDSLWGGGLLDFVRLTREIFERKRNHNRDIFKDSLGFQNCDNFQFLSI